MENYIYLRHLIHLTSCTELEIERERQARLISTGQWKRFLNGNLSIKPKTKAMETSLLPCQTYACQTMPGNCAEHMALK